MVGTQKVNKDISTPFFNTQKIVFDKNTTDSFQREVTKNVDDYFTSNSIPKTGNREMYIKSAVILSTWLITYLLILSQVIAPWAMLVLALIHGVSAAAIGMSIAHDAMHGSYSNSPIINKIATFFFLLVGANDYIWKLTHNVIHHTYTNIPHHDADIHQIPILRIQPTQEKWYIHKFQYIYAWFFYSLASISWVLVKDFVLFFKKDIQNFKTKSAPKKEIVRLFLFKAVYYLLFLVTPLLVLDLHWGWIIGGFIASHLVEGLTLGIIFMLAHVVDETKFPQPTNEEGNINLGWADLQMHTTANFGMNNKVLNWICGGLNFQIEHHLFPQICHVHYPALSEIVKDTALKHNLPYIEFEHFSTAIQSHIRLLKKFGN